MKTPKPDERQNVDQEQLEEEEFEESEDAPSGIRTMASREAKDALTVLILLVSTKSKSAAGSAEIGPGVSEGRSLDSDALENRGLRNCIL